MTRPPPTFVELHPDHPADCSRIGRVRAQRLGLVRVKLVALSGNALDGKSPEFYE
jgi:hypothetical protein